VRAMKLCTRELVHRRTAAMNRPDYPKGGGVEDRNQAEPRLRSPGDETRRIQRVVRLGGAVERDSDELQPRGWVFRVAAGGDGDRGGRAGEQPFADRPGQHPTDRTATRRAEDDHRRRLSSVVCCNSRAAQLLAITSALATFSSASSASSSRIALASSRM
jgi:hypothetical protein